MLLSTTPTIEGHTIREYKGIVTGETIIGANFMCCAKPRTLPWTRCGNAPPTSGPTLSSASTSTMRQSGRVAPCSWWPSVVRQSSSEPIILLQVGTSCPYLPMGRKGRLVIFFKTTLTSVNLVTILLLLTIGYLCNK